MPQREVYPQNRAPQNPTPRPPQRPRRQKKNAAAFQVTIVLAAILLLAVILNVFIFGTLHQKTTPQDHTDLRTAPVLPDEEENGTQNLPKSTIPGNYTSIVLTEGEVHLGDLILVNSDAAFVSPEDSGVSASVIAFETPADVYTYKTRDYSIFDTSIDLNPTVIDRLNTMFADYVAYAGKPGVMINAAYRSIEQQTSIYAQKGADIAAKPGYSEHHSGLAFDICILEDGVSRTFADEEPFTWIPQNCKNYGFIRRYPEGKSDITKITFEPWHFRYVGVPHAAYITDNGLVLEEYITLLKGYTLTGEHLAVEAGGKNYEIYYVPSTGEQTNVYVPKDHAYTVSGNNVDGFIVTVDLSVSGAPETPLDPAAAE